MDDRVTGRIAYSQDVERPGMLHGRMLRSHPRTRACSACAWSTSCRRAASSCCPRTSPDTRLYGCLVPDTPILARGVARFAGDPVAAVAAPTPRAAARALTCLEADYEPLPEATSLAAALADGAPQLHELDELRGAAGTWTGLRPGGGNVLHTFRLVHGRGEAGFDEAEVTVEGEWECAGAAHAPLEPHAALAEWSDGRLTVWTGTQTPFNVRRELAGAFALDEGDVRVVSPPMGGSFGAKTFTRIEAIAAALARKAELPVRIVLPRDEVFVTLVRHPARFRVRLGARRDGTFVARRVWADWDTGAYADTGPNVARRAAGLQSARIASTTWRSTRAACTRTPRRPARSAAMRRRRRCGPPSSASTCSPSELGADPLELRLRNVLRDGDRFATGETMHDFHVAECLERVAERIGWSAGRRGKGLCAVMKGMQTPSRSEARIVLDGGASRSRARRPTSARGAIRASGSWPLARSAATRRSSTPPASTPTTRPSTRARPRAARRT